MGSGKPCGSPTGQGHGFKKGERIGLFTYSGVATGDPTYNGYEAIQWVYSSGTSPDQMIPDYSLYSFDKKAWPMDFTLPAEYQTGFNAYPGTENYVGDSLFERYFGLVEDSDSVRYFPYAVGCTGTQIETPWRIQDPDIYDYPSNSNSLPGLSAWNIPVKVADSGFYN